MSIIEYSNDIGDINKNIKNMKNKIQIKNKLLIVVNDMNADMFSNKKLNPIVTELFIRCKKLHIYLVFITKFYFAVLKNI